MVMWSDNAQAVILDIGVGATERLHLVIYSSCLLVFSKMNQIKFISYQFEEAECDGVIHHIGQHKSLREKFDINIDKLEYHRCLFFALF